MRFITFPEKSFAVSKENRKFATKKVSEQKNRIMSVVALQKPTISPLDALWTLFKSQSKAVRTAFAKRLLHEDKEASTLRQQHLVEESLTQAFKELDESEKKGIELPDARNLFK